MSNGFDVDPNHLRRVAVQIEDLTTRVESLGRRSTDGETSPTSLVFPQHPQGQRAGQIWQDARPVFTQALTQAAQMLARTGNNFRAAAAAYEQADSNATSRMGPLQ
ncbi:type VII secretion target [Micromonospora zhanjiangensis]|uniref:Type VII secretion target n=1 Tax=Micromonospora zhanjiangensis TaxID=1522057 RepID=A0ABV8KL10_9ACTN